jgi:hypothetical protein
MYEVEVTSTKERVELRERLSGQGHEADCIVSAIKVTLPGPSAYAGYSVRSVSKTLPEGDYQIFLSNGETFPVRHHGGNWGVRRAFVKALHLWTATSS